MFGERQKDFILYLGTEKRYSPNTTEAYEKDLEQFSQYLQNEYGQLTDVAVTHFHIRGWLAGLKDSGLADRSINRKRSSLNSYYKYLVKNELTDKNPVGKVHARKLADRLPSFLKEPETTRLFEEIDFGEGFIGYTDRLICELLYVTGMRRGELVQLKETDVEWSLSQIRILGKGNKERLVPVSQVILDTLKEYINEKKKLGLHNNSALLVLDTGLPLYPMYVYRVVTRNLQGVSTLKKKSPHIFRHTFATHLLGNGANIQAIKDLLGHSSLASTQVYTHNDISRLKDIHKQNHPRG